MLALAESPTLLDDGTLILDDDVILWTRDEVNAIFWGDKDN